MGFNSAFKGLIRNLLPSFQLPQDGEDHFSEYLKADTFPSQ